MYEEFFEGHAVAWVNYQHFLNYCLCLQANLKRICYFLSKSLIDLSETHSFLLEKRIGSEVHLVNDDSKAPDITFLVVVFVV